MKTERHKTRSGNLVQRISGTVAATAMTVALFAGLGSAEVVASDRARAGRRPAQRRLRPARGAGPEPAAPPRHRSSAAPLAASRRRAPGSLGAVTVSLLLYNRDLRVHDHPALRAATCADRMVPLFVFDERILASGFASPNRIAFMLDALADLKHSLRRLGAPLVVRRGDPVREVMRLAKQAGATQIHASADFSALARRRERRLAAACEAERMELWLHPGVTIVQPGRLRPSGGDHFKVFGPYYRAWSEVELEPPGAPPRRLSSPSRLTGVQLPALRELTSGSPSPDLAPGGEREGRRLMRAFVRDSLSGYGEAHDDLSGDRTSRLSAYLRFGCVSPRELAARARAERGGEAYVRQLCWRDFHHQVLAAFPAYPNRNYRSRGDRWSRSRRALEAWKEGLTGYPIVDAGMRQLTREGFMHNRARLITASFLTKDLYIDWRVGRPALLGAAGRRRDRQQLRQLAVGRRHRQ